jgi:cell division septation protein DedD
MSNPTNSEIAGKSSRRIVISLSIPALVTLVIVISLGFSWAFWLGLRTAQEQNGTETDFLMQSSANPALSDEEADRSAETGMVELIQEEDLNFKANLEQNNEVPAELQASAPSSNMEAPLSGRSAQGDQSSAPLAAASGNAAPDNFSGIFSYQYQIASYSRTAQAEELTAKLLARGITAHTETALIQGQPRYRVLISFQGDDKSVTLMKQRIKQDFGIEGILPRSKKIIPR